MSKGAYRQRKSLIVYYAINANGAWQIVSVVQESGRLPEFLQGRTIANLPAMEVTASRYRDFATKKVRAM